MANVAAEPAAVLHAPAPVELAARSSTSDCASNGGGCETTNGNSTTIPIAIGVA